MIFLIILSGLSFSAYFLVAFQTTTLYLGILYLNYKIAEDIL